MFTLLGQWIARRPGVFIAVWGIAVAGGVGWDVWGPRVDAGDVGSFLPADSPHNIGMALFRDAFPQVASRSQIVLVACREGGLTAEDIAWLHGVAATAARETGYSALSPAMPYLNRRLVSKDGEAAMVVVNLPTNFISEPTVATVERFEASLKTDRPEGLTYEITGTAGIGRDYSQATERAIHATTWVTVCAVLIILIVIYRSPIGALVPLLSIGASVYLAFVMLGVLNGLGMDVSNIEKIFAVVLLFGAGVDYALFWIARYREGLAESTDYTAAAVHASRYTSPAILASAGTTICGLSVMLVADLVPSRNAGAVLAPVLVVAMLAALTLSPALARVLGRGLFWPMGMAGKPTVSERWIWPRLAAWVTTRPGFVLGLGLLVLGVPAVWAMRIPVRYDSLSELPPNSSAERGFDILATHYPGGELFATQIIYRFEGGLPAGEVLRRLSANTVAALTGIDGVEDVYALTQPLGGSPTSSTAVSDGSPTTSPSGLLDQLLVTVARPFYVSDERPVMRVEVLTGPAPFSPEAMELIQRVRDLGRAQAAALRSAGVMVEAHAAGVTPYIIDVRAVTRRDELVVKPLATLVIGLIVLVLVKDLLLATFMLLATWLTYGVTLSVSHLFFTYVMQEGGLDWKVGLIVFVIVVAVGQDYNILLVSRLLREMETADVREATRRAIVRTGAVISSCGVIMAATLGSLWVGHLSLLRQVGFALAVGILIDTFFVRPLVIPSFFLATRRGRLTRPER